MVQNNLLARTDNLHERHFVEQEDEQDIAVSLAEPEEYASVQM